MKDHSYIFNLWCKYHLPYLSLPFTYSVRILSIFEILWDSSFSYSGYVRFWPAHKHAAAMHLYEQHCHFKGYHWSRNHFDILTSFCHVSDIFLSSLYHLFIIFLSSFCPFVFLYFCLSVFVPFCHSFFLSVSAHPSSSKFILVHWGLTWINPRPA